MTESWKCPCAAINHSSQTECHACGENRNDGAGITYPPDVLRQIEDLQEKDKLLCYDLAKSFVRNAKLREYAKHKQTCPRPVSISLHPLNNCDCGLDKLLDEAAAAEPAGELTYLVCHHCKTRLPNCGRVSGLFICCECIMSGHNQKCSEPCDKCDAAEPAGKPEAKT